MHFLYYTAFVPWLCWSALSHCYVCCNYTSRALSSWSRVGAMLASLCSLLQRDVASLTMSQSRFWGVNVEIIPKIYTLCYKNIATSSIFLPVSHYLCTQNL